MDLRALINQLAVYAATYGPELPVKVRVAHEPGDRLPPGLLDVIVATAGEDVSVFGRPRAVEIWTMGRA